MNWYKNTYICMVWLHCHETPEDPKTVLFSLKNTKNRGIVRYGFRVGGAINLFRTVDKILPWLCLLARRSKWMLFLYVSLMEVFSGLRTMWYKLGWEVENKSSVNGMFFVTSPLLSLSLCLPPKVIHLMCYKYLKEADYYNLANLKSWRLYQSRC